jgi:hypothetical protein
MLMVFSLLTLKDSYSIKDSILNLESEWPHLVFIQVSLLIYQSLCSLTYKLGIMVDIVWEINL